MKIKMTFKKEVFRRGTILHDLHTMRGERRHCSMDAFELRSVNPRHQYRIRGMAFLGYEFWGTEFLGMKFGVWGNENTCGGRGEVY